MPHFNRILVIMNPTAGQRSAARLRSRIEAYFLEKGHDFVLRESEAKGDALKWARTATAEGFDLVVAAGGDGTIREAAEGLMRSGARIPLAQVPAGTTNFSARALAIPTNVRSALDLIDTGKVERFDIGYLPEHDQYFVFIAGTGYDAILIHDTPDKLKRRFGFLAYVATGIREFFRLRPVRMEVEIDNQKRQFRAHTIMAVNIGSIANLRFSFAPDIDPHDGLLNIAIMSSRSFWGSLIVLLKILAKRYYGYDDLKLTKARRIRITADPPLPVEFDGEPLGTTPFLAEIIPDAISYLVPGDYAPEMLVERTEATFVPQPSLGATSG
ncbi:MAG: diacylglycerol kinase family lipid kinase [Candidatus Latescibacterota bacterium]|nr:MAG: diacylglycerol kinase family lipid kinase [Candidatus Latescibacterota bacterium]